MSSNASKTFKDLLKHVDQLRNIHTRLQTGRGRRFRQEALHPAGVVLVIAAWEGYIESVVEEVAIAFYPGGSPPALEALKVHVMFMANVKYALSRFNTPNAEQVQELFQKLLGANPWPWWVWRLRRRQWDEVEVRTRMNAWLRIRHTIAHGKSLPDNISWIKDRNGRPRLVLNHLDECEQLFGHLVKQTDEGLCDYVVGLGLLRPW